MKRCQKLGQGSPPPHLDKIQKKSSFFSGDLPLVSKFFYVQNNQNMCKYSTTSETGLFFFIKGCFYYRMRTYFFPIYSSAKGINQEGSILPPKQKLVVLGAVQRLKPDLPTRAPHPPTGVARTTWAPRENISIGMIFNFLSQTIQSSR